MVEKIMPSGSQSRYVVDRMLAERPVSWLRKPNPFDIHSRAGGEPIGLCLFQGLAYCSDEKFPVLCRKFPVMAPKIPCSVA